ncbi:MAG: tRNA (guanine(46)-N(7))-methyltransferase TrmB [Bifidobacterium sp.]|uniref:tRNA (guanine-N(7)-)-methyltransferase n=1 Tax=Bifidobacterium fermentum TaxID=3059035 RepID=A0AB39UNE4_9BIFI
MSVNEPIGSPAGSSEYAGRRSIVSYVRRSGHIDPRLQRAWEKYHDRFLIDLHAQPGVEQYDSAEMAERASLEVPEGFVLDEAFIEERWGNSNPLTVEVGTGQGENIVAAAAEHRDRNFLAVEVYTVGLAHTMLMAGKAGLTNLRLAQVNAPELFAAAVPGSVAEVWTFFPDPWPKMRHHKRRIIQPEFARSVSRALIQSGVWRIATDIDDYALHVHEVLDDADFLINCGTLKVRLPLEHVGKGTAGQAQELPHGEFMESERFEGRTLTNFERKGLHAGRTIHDFTYRAAASI